MPGITDGSDGCDAEHFLFVRKTKAFLYMNTHPESLQKEQQTAYKCSDTQIGFTRSDSVLKGDTGNKQYMISTETQKE
ncbi:MAG: hypothetical protein ACLR56_15025 [Oscillospiraceae bacterium]